MTEPKSWLLLESFQRCLASITIADSYRTDAGANITLEPNQEPGEDRKPLLCAFTDAIDRPQDPAIRRTGKQISLMVVAKIPCDLDDAQILQHYLLEDIEKAMTGRYEVFGAGEQYPQFQEARFINRIDGLAWVGVAVRYVAHLTRK